MPKDKNAQRFAERDTAAFEFLPPRKRLAHDETGTDPDEDDDEDPDIRSSITQV